MNVDFVVNVSMNQKSSPPGKLADAEVRFTSGILAGLKLIGFGVWERRGAAGRSVTVPSRTYSVNGERRSFALLRPMGDAAALNAIRDAILDAVAAAEAQSE